ncbi:MAG: hypothetical protein QXV53_05680, partial [Zestosphaera sp.]
MDIVNASKSEKDTSSRGGMIAKASSLLAHNIKNNITRKAAEAVEEDNVYKVREILGSSRMFEVAEA